MSPMPFLPMRHCIRYVWANVCSCLSGRAGAISFAPLGLIIGTNAHSRGFRPFGADDLCACAFPQLTLWAGCWRPFGAGPCADVTDGSAHDAGRQNVRGEKLRQERKNKAHGVSHGNRARCKSAPKGRKKRGRCESAARQGKDEAGAVGDGVVEEEPSAHAPGQTATERQS